MCGILFIASNIVESEQAINVQTDSQIIYTSQHFAESLGARGPDSGLCCTSVRLGLASLVFGGSLLQLRGDSHASTPLIHATPSGESDIFVWNGEIFGGAIEVAPGLNDGQVLFSKLRESAAAGKVDELVFNLKGPWSLIFWHSDTQTLWFGRDPLGRRSLLVHLPTLDRPQFVLTSVVPVADNVPYNGFTEVTPGLHSIRIKSIDGAPGRLEVGSLTAYRKTELSFRRKHILMSSFLQQEEKYSFIGADALREVAVTSVLEALRQAVSIRCQCIDTVPHRESPGVEEGPDAVPARIMILFSGGVDSTLIAALASEALPQDLPIDLVSICFANGTSPDRISALDSLEELGNAYPTRKWRFIAVNKSYEDVEACRPRLLRLLIPSETVMDLNIGAALWLAAQGEGYVYPSPREEHSEIPMKYRSRARVVLLGHGADELFGGYGRHRTRFRSGGWAALEDELAMDMRRLWVRSKSVRNLGRDDRLVADRGREARHPFLDEEVIHEALQWPLESLVDLRLESGVGDKSVLRACLGRLGLPRAAVRVKRAIQFGTRLAKAANAVQFGGTKRANARNAGSVRLDDISVM